ncbi:ABC transporter permease [Streptomyces sp. NPDC094153]|uniref:ABC transporter permease n=1 Tax=Streptomyces sp. NPDC094153 TaxID=3366058 RepID=UPI003810485C
MAEFLGDTRAIAGRHLRHLLRLPEKLVGFTVMPVAMVVGLGILFGGSMRVPGGGPYGAYVAAGVVTSLAVSTVALSALGVLDDLQNGVFDRLRSLPVDRAAILSGRIVVNSLPVVVAMAGVVPAAWIAGWADGVRPTAALAAVGLELLLGMGCACLGIFLGLTFRNAEAVTSVVPVCLLPATFLSNAFVPPDGLPGWLRQVVGWNPVTAVNSTVRELLGTGGPPAGAAFPDRHAAPLAVVFCLLVIAVTAPAAARAYGRAGPMR